MKQCLFSSKTILAMIVAGAVAMVPAASASASTNSTTIFTTLQGTSVLGHDVPIIGTRGYNITLPIPSSDVPQVVSNAIDITADVDITALGIQVANLYVDPKMAR